MNAQVEKRGAHQSQPCDRAKPGGPAAYRDAGASHPLSHNWQRFSPSYSPHAIPCPLVIHPEARLINTVDGVIFTVLSTRLRVRADEMPIWPPVQENRRGLFPA